MSDLAYHYQADGTGILVFTDDLGCSHLLMKGEPNMVMEVQRAIVQHFMRGVNAMEARAKRAEAELKRLRTPVDADSVAGE